MSFADDFLKKMKMVSDDDEDYDDDYDDYDDESDESDEEDEDDEIISPRKKKPAKAKKSFFSRMTSRSADDEDETDDEEEYDETDDAEEEETADSYRTSFVKKESRSASAHTGSNVVGMKSSKAVPEVCMIMPKSFDDANTIADVLLNHKAVVLNLEGIDMTAAQRIIDFASGSCYTVGGNLQKISKKIFIVVPRDMTLSGDFDDLIGDMVDLNSVSIMK